ncbi:uncharacterized protein LOC106177297 [Lingula anatina]|uniref:Uncharacterized protein LOC106177297 n=1 Tax=Lingula anatina TaxID=7574 RepID=A0A1S3JYJ1_LINAN|nr:uncharacterized protein LOC106177297 [Lingula anatina]|eukprot:XP_013415490.1 uncharacterized protein LOC106177297 [Lingula anatina]
MGDKLYNIVRVLLAYLVCCHQEKSSTSSSTTTSTTTSTKTVHVAVGAGKLKGGEAHYSPEDVGVIVGTVVAEVIILLGAAVVLFVLFRRGILHRFWKKRQSGDTVNVDVTESNNEYALLDIKEVKSKNSFICRFAHCHIHLSRKKLTQNSEER